MSKLRYRPNQQREEAPDYICSVDYSSMHKVAVTRINIKSGQSPQSIVLNHLMTVCIG